MKYFFSNEHEVADLESYRPVFCYNVIMENNILREIIDVEKEIQLSVDKAKVSVGEWLDARKKEIEQEAAKEEKDILASFQKAREKTILDAANRASELVSEAEKQADRIKHLKSQTLSGIVVNHIHKILPG
jgi:broad specificity phosphatase PhoE